MVKKILSIHYIVSIVVFAAGLTNFLTSLSLHHIPHIKLLEGIIPLYFKHTARTFTLLTGIYLMMLSFNLFKRKRRAWMLSLVLISTSIMLQLLRGFNVVEILFLVSLLFILLITRHVFEIESDKNKAIYGVARFAIILALLFIYAFFGFYLFQGQFSHQVNIQNIIADYLYSIAGIGQEILIPVTKNALWFSDSISIVSVVMFLSSLVLLFKPLIEANKTTVDDKEKIRQLVLEQGNNSVSYFSLTEEKQYFFDREKNIVLSYVIKSGFAIVLGDPIGANNNETLVRYCQQFISENSKKDIKTLFYNTAQEAQSLYTAIGYKSIKIGEEALLSTDTFTLVGSSMADIRHEVTKIQRENGIFSWFTMDQIPWRYIDEINKLHDSWTKLKKAPLLTFSLDFFPFPIEENAYVLVISGQDGLMWGALSFFPYNNNAMALDFMIRSPQAPHGVVEAGINEAMNFFRTKNIKVLSLGMAPLSDITIQKNKNISEKIKNIVFERFNQFYQYKSLFKFKNKFNPQWEHKYLIYKNDMDLPSIMIALAQVHLKEPFTLTSLFK